MLGGTFDPPHIGHLALAQAAWEQLAVGTVTFLPAGDPWQKSDDRHVTPAAIRCEMVEAAVGEIPYFGVDLRETERGGPTYTWDTVRSFVDDEPVLVLGADSAAGLKSWHRGQDLIDGVEIAVVGRPGTSRDDVMRVVPSARWMEMPALDISSTELRDWIGSGFSARFLVPDPVLDVIRFHGLYSATQDQLSR
ncbi:MAG TPA: nicotinate (nicotinamide) nucleotide adenylyltransferase [Acidimicrobiia bacterium]|nr:nicotinate (nicotinamide) nucleotide adenylyltransferase [Acidimicrobiia bacterium]